MVTVNVFDFLHGKRVLVADLQERFLKEKGRISKQSQAQYRWMFRKVAEYSRHWFRSPSEVNAFISSLDGYSDVTIWQLWKCLRAVGRYTKRTYGWRDPIDGSETPRVKHKKRRYFSEEEIVSIIEACKSPRERVLILAAMDSSARIGELAGICVEDLGKDYFDVRGKTGERRYRCDSRIITMMREIAVEGIVFPAKMSGSGNKLVTPVHHTKADYLAHEVKRIMKRAGLNGKKLGPHTLRHTAASLVARSTKSILAVKSILQHDDVKTSMGYIHDVEDSIQRAVSPLSLAGIVLPPGKEDDTDPADDVADKRGITEKVNEKLNKLFPDIEDGTAIRPFLKDNDLRLIRTAFIELMRSRNETNVGNETVQLMRRMLRRVKRGQGRSEAK
jgi:integrase